MYGLQEGSIVLVHASLKSLSRIPQHPAAVVSGIRKAIGNSGTLLMPALTYQRVTAEKPCFDVCTTPSNVGALPEYFRNMQGVERSLHPTHSVCAQGRYARDFLRYHHLDNTPAGQHSPFSLLPSCGGKILFLGCGLRPNTSMHAIEELVAPEYLFGEMVNYQVRDASGKLRQMRVRNHKFKGFEQRYERAARLLGSGEIKEFKVLAAKSYLVDARALWRAAFKKLQQDPCYFVDRIWNDPVMAG